MSTSLTYFECIQRAIRILGRPVPDSFIDLANEFQLNIKALVNQVNKDVLMAYTYPCRHRTTTISIDAETSENYSSVTNTIPGEIKKDANGRSLLYDVDDGIYYNYNPNVAEFLIGNAGAYDFGFRNNKILFDANEDARTLYVEYYTNKLALDGVEYDDFVEGTTTEKDELSATGDYSIIPGVFHEPIIVYGTCYYFELQKNESNKLQAFKKKFDDGVMQLNAHNRAEVQETEIQIGDIGRDYRRSAV
jgi:hypothetical protein